MKVPLRNNYQSTMPSFKLNQLRGIPNGLTIESYGLLAIIRFGSQNLLEINIVTGEFEIPCEYIFTKRSLELLNNTLKILGERTKLIKVKEVIYVEHY